MTAPERDSSAAGSHAGAPLVEARQVAVTHAGEPGPTPASVSLTVDPGEVVLLLGPSGSGKSTLTLALNGLIPHDIPATVGGELRVGGRDASAATVAELSTRVGMVFQDPDAQLVTGTLLDEVAFGPENLRVPAAEVLARAESALRRVGLWERRSDNPDLLSGGGRQRLAIACALAMRSPLLVLDEPTANLDPRGIEEVYAALAEIAAEGDRGILLVEHNLDAAVALVDRVVVLDHGGTVVADGGVDDVLRGQAAQLHRMGVWLPVSTLAALRLRRAGYALDPLPVTPSELHDALTALPPIPDTTAAESPTDAAGGRGAALIRVRNLRTRRGRTTILHGVDLDVAEGAFVAVVGANGAGKTSLLQAIAGVSAPPPGSVRIGDLDVGRADVRTLARRIGFVFQNPEHQFITHTVVDELAHGLRQQRLPDAEVRARVAEMLERFGLTAKADAHPFLLSGGQKRRLSVATALVAGAPVLALDEPTFGQDRARADELLSVLQRLNAEGTTILIVSHDLQLVAEYADRTVVMAAGRILAEGPTGALLDDDALLDAAGLRPPPLRRAFAGLAGHPRLADATRLRDLPGGAS